MNPAIAILTLVLLAALAALGLVSLRTNTVASRAKRRLEAPLDNADAERPASTDTPEPRQRTRQSILRRARIVPWLVGIVLGVAVALLSGLPWIFGLLLAAAVILLGGQVEATIADRRRLRIENQLADTIDIMVSALTAGATLLRALEHAASEIPRPFRPHLEELLTRSRYVEPPADAFRDLGEAIPLDNFRLFATSLAVHWETGGTLGPTLALVGRAVRDRIEIARRARALTSQARLSVLFVLLATYFILLVNYANDPEGTLIFLNDPTAQTLIAFTVLLQAIGVAWISAISRPNL